MSTRSLQLGLAAVFFVLGGWCVVAPRSVVELGVRPELQSNAPIVPILMACFGSQALISGLFAATSRFTRWTFLAYAVGLVPFFAFDIYFYAVKPALTVIGAGGDFVGNCVMLVLCLIGWRRTGR